MNYIISTIWLTSILYKHRQSIPTNPSLSWANGIENVRIFNMSIILIAIINYTTSILKSRHYEVLISGHFKIWFLWMCLICLLPVKVYYCNDSVIERFVLLLLSKSREVKISLQCYGNTRILSGIRSSSISSLQKTMFILETFKMHELPKNDHSTVIHSSFNGITLISAIS